LIGLCNDQQTDDGQLFIVMACYEGETLKKKVDLPLLYRTRS